MKSSRYGGEFEYIHSSKWSAEALGQFVFTNMTPEAEQAIDDRVVTPTVHEFLRLAGVEIDGQPSLSIDELIGPTTIGQLPRSTHAFYFSGPNHPALVNARKRPTFLTYDEFLATGVELGVAKSTATKNFLGLISAIFADPEIETYGDPHGSYHADDDAGHVPRLKRFAIRRQIAHSVMRGDYRPEFTVAGATFNGFGRAILKGLYEPDDAVDALELSMQLEAIDRLVVDSDDPDRFDWNKVYVDTEGVSHNIGMYDLNWSFYNFIVDLLQEVGAPIQKGSWDRVDISEETFVAVANALCPMDKDHTKVLSSGSLCKKGVHAQGVSKKIIQKARSVAHCIMNDWPGFGGALGAEEDINVQDPGLMDGPAIPKAVDPSQFQWS